MICKRLTTLTLSALLMLIAVVANAQTFAGSTVNTAGNSTIPSTGTGGCTIAPQTTGGTVFNNTVAGIPANFTVDQVQINLTHTFTSDLDIFLQAPNGQRIELTSDNGGGGDNYTNTIFSDCAATSITAGVPPFTGTFRPEGTTTVSCANLAGNIAQLGAFAPGQNGTWQLVIMDDVGGDVGTMLGWSITFAQPCDFVLATLPPLNVLGNDPAVCGATNAQFVVPALTGGCATATLVSVTVDGVAFGQFAPGTIFAVPSLASGAHVLGFSILNGCRTRTQAVTVTDGVKPNIVCPGNVTLNLPPGACEIVYNYKDRKSVV